MKIEELYDVLLSEKPSEDIIKNEKEIFELIPELRICKGFKQFNRWHIYDVYEHILHVVDNVEPNIILRLSALFHDIGKPKKFTLDEEGVGHFYGHWEESEKIFKYFSKKYNIDKEISEKVCKLIYFHDINIGRVVSIRLEEILKIFDKDDIKMLYKLKKADLLSQNSEYHYLLDDYDKQEKELLREYK